MIKSYAVFLFSSLLSQKGKDWQMVRYREVYSRIRERHRFVMLWDAIQKLLLNIVEFVRLFGGRLQIYTILNVHQ